MTNDAFEFPELIKDAVKGLDSKTRWRIVEYLVSNGNVSYTKLLNELNINLKGNLTFHLDILSKSGLIERRENFGQKSGEKVFYDISPIGKDVINGLLSALTPLQKPVITFHEDFKFYANAAFVTRNPISTEPSTQESSPYSSGPSLTVTAVTIARAQKI